MGLLLALLLLAATGGCAEVVLQILQPHGLRIISFAEVQLLQHGQVLPDHLYSLSFSSETVSHNDVQFCKDSDILTFCQNSIEFSASRGLWEGSETVPFLEIRLTEAFFDELVLIYTTGKEDYILGAEMKLYDNDKPVQLLKGIFQTATKFHRIKVGHLLQRDPYLPMRIVDVIPYNGDLIALTRIKYLYDVIDEFIVVESWFTFSGQVKPKLYFLEADIYSQFIPYMQKIKYVVIKNMPAVPVTYSGPMFNFTEGTLDSWWREEYTRSYFKFFIRPYSDMDISNIVDSPTDMYIVCDCDEIPSRDVLSGLRTDGRFAKDVNLNAPLHFSMYFFYYNLHWLLKSYWGAPYMISGEGLFQLNDISYPRYAGGAEVGHGWHCSFFMSVEKMVHKIESFSHQEYNIDSFKNYEHIRNCIKNGLDILDRPPDKWEGFFYLTDDVIREIVPTELFSFHHELENIQLDTIERIDHATEIRDITN